MALESQPRDNIKIRSGPPTNRYSDIPDTVRAKGLAFELLTLDLAKRENNAASFAGISLINLLPEN